MGAFNINITGVGGHGCERDAKPGDKLFKRCGRFTCPDCLAYDFTQRLKQSGMVRDGDGACGAELTHSPACSAPMGTDQSDCSCGAVPKGAEIYFTDANGTVVVGLSAPPIGGRAYWQTRQHALFTHWPDTKNAVVDDMLKNERMSGQF